MNSSVFKVCIGLAKLYKSLYKLSSTDLPQSSTGWQQNTIYPRFLQESLLVKLTPTLREKLLVFPSISVTPGMVC